MSVRNADSTRDQKSRKLRLRLREPFRTLAAGGPGRADKDASAAATGTETAASKDAASRAASLAMQNEGGPTGCEE